MRLSTLAGDKGFVDTTERSSTGCLATCESAESPAAHVERSVLALTSVAGDGIEKGP